MSLEIILFMFEWCERSVPFFLSSSFSVRLFSVCLCVFMLLLFNAFGTRLLRSSYPSAECLIFIFISSNIVFPSTERRWPGQIYNSISHLPQQFTVKSISSRARYVPRCRPTIPPENNSLALNPCTAQKNFILQFDLLGINSLVSVDTINAHTHYAERSNSSLARCPSRPFLVSGLDVSKRKC